MWAPSIQFCYKILELVKGGNENQILIIDHDQRKKNEQYPNQLFPINGHGYHMKCYDKITTTLTKYTQIYISFLAYFKVYNLHHLSITSCYSFLKLVSKVVVS
jgi:hypothetical protein